MVLHAAAHLFHDGEITGAIRDLVDLDRLLRHFGEDSNFWNDLVREARELHLTRPMYYAIRYSRKFLQTPIPQEFIDELSGWSPGPVRGNGYAGLRTLPGMLSRGSSRSARIREIALAAHAPHDGAASPEERTASGELIDV
jgi:hypothetical protein